MHKSKNTDALIAFILGLVLILPFAAWHGFVLKTLWGWFVVPLGVHGLGLWQAAGITLIVRLFYWEFFVPLQEYNKENTPNPIERLFREAITSLILFGIALLAGAIYHGLS